MDRRSHLRWITLAGLSWALAGCQDDRSSTLRVGTHPWPGYEFLHLAQHLGHLEDGRIRLVQGSSASSTIRSLKQGLLEAGCLTLYEVLSVRDQGTPLTVIAVLNESHGADAVLGRPRISDLRDLRRTRIGVEKTAVGALMLDAALKAAQLRTDDVELRYLTVDQHEAAWASGEVDALVTFEPVKSRLLQQGAHLLYSSRQTPGLIIDVLAVRTDLLDPQAGLLRSLVGAHFAALNAWQSAPRQYDAFMGGRLQTDPALVADVFAELSLPDVAQNRQLLGGEAPLLRTSAEHIGQVLLRGGLLKQAPRLEQLCSPTFLA